MGEAAGGMPQNATGNRPFTWTPQRTRAAELVADDLLSDEEIVAEVNVADRKTLWRWQQHPDFIARVAERREAHRCAIEAKGLADRDNRLKGYQDRYDRLQRVIEARAADPTMADVPGGKEGVLVREVKFVKVFEVLVRPDGDETVPAMPTKQYREVAVYSVDTGMLKEMDHLAKQAAEDLGQWVTKGELTGKGGEPLFKSYAGFDPEEV